MTIDGVSVLTVRPDFAEPPQIVAVRSTALTSSGQSRRYAGFVGKDAVHTLRQRFVLTGANLATFEDFFNAAAGQWGKVLIPSWHYELTNGNTNATNSASGQPNLRIDWCDYANVFNPASSELSKLGHYVFVLWPDGQFFAARVNSVASSSVGVHDTLALASNLPRQVTADHGQIIGFCYMARFSGDEIEMQFHGPTVAQVEAAFLGVLDAVPPADVT